MLKVLTASTCSRFLVLTLRPVSPTYTALQNCRDCNAVYVGETGRSVRTRKREHVDAVKTFNTKKSALSQHVMDFDHRIDWDNVKILKSESHAYRRRVAESFLINRKACSCNVINRNDGANFPTVYSVFVSNK